MDIEKHGFDKADLVIAMAVSAYLKNLTTEARKETLSAIVKQDGAEIVIDGAKLITLIENAKAAAMISAGAWQHGEGDYQRSLAFIRDNPITAMGWGRTSYSVETRLVVDKTGEQMILINLNTAKEADAKEINGAFMFPECFHDPDNDDEEENDEDEDSE